MATDFGTIVIALHIEMIRENPRVDRDLACCRKTPTRDTGSSEVIGRQLSDFLPLQQDLLEL